MGPPGKHAGLAGTIALVRLPRLWQKCPSFGTGRRLSVAPGSVFGSQVRCTATDLPLTRTRKMYVRRLLLLAAMGAFASSNSLMADVYHPKKVGIGTHHPTERLTLYAGNFALQAADNLEDQSILFQNTELDYTWRIYRTDVDGLLADLRIAGGLSPDSATLPDILTLCNTGRVGIGTADPANRLSVAGDVGLSGSLGVDPTGIRVPAPGSKPASRSCSCLLRIEARFWPDQPSAEWTAISSMSKITVAFGGITGGLPASP